MHYEWDFSFLLDHKAFIIEGLLGTLWLSGITLGAGVVLGLIFAMARLSRIGLFRLAGTAYVEFFRNIPALVQVFWFYFTIPILTGAQPNAFWACGVALSLYAGAYFTETFRSGIQSVEKGQWEAGKAIGFSESKIMRYIVLPQAFRYLLPALTNRVLEVVKMTTVAATIAYGELLHSGKLLSEQNYRPLESYTAVGAFFIVFLLLISWGSSLLERRLHRQS